MSTEPTNASPSGDELQTAKSHADLRKLEPEISPPERRRFDETLQMKKSEAEYEKLKLEISSLQWQNSWVARLTTFAAIATVLATLAGIWVAYENFTSDQEKNRRLRNEELIDRNYNLYRTDLLQLSQYSTDGNLTVQSAMFLFKDIDDLIKNLPADLDKVDSDNNRKQLQAQRREDVGRLLFERIRSEDYVFDKPRNVEFDRKATDFCVPYVEFLQKNPNSHMNIISKCYLSLRSLTQKDPAFYQSVVYKDDGEVFPNGKDVTTFMNLVYDYQTHVWLLHESLNDNPAEAEKIKNHLHLSFCWFYGATKNDFITQKTYLKIYPWIDGPRAIQEEWRKCE